MNRLGMRKVFRVLTRGSQNIEPFFLLYSINHHVTEVLIESLINKNASRFIIILCPGGLMLNLINSDIESVYNPQL